jgi:hypothetical protein
MSVSSMGWRNFLISSHRAAKAGPIDPIGVASLASKWSPNETKSILFQV